MPPDVLFVVQHANRRNRLLNALVDNVGSDAHIEVAVFDGEGPMDDDLAARGVPVHHHRPASKKSLPGIVIGLRRLLPRFSVVQSNGYLPSVAVEFARALTRRPTPSVLARHYNLEHHLAAPRWHVAVDRWSASHATLVLAVSEAVRDTLVGEGVPADHIEVVSNGMDWDLVTADPAAVDRWKARFAGCRLAVAVGRINALKDHGTLLRAFALARREHPDLRLLIAGDGGPGAADQLRAEAEELGIAESVTLLGWIADVFDVVAASDVFVQASLDESFGQAVLEAAVLGTPLAVTTVGGVGDVLDGLHPPVKASDPVVLSKRLLEVLDAAPGTRLPPEVVTSLRSRFSAAAMASGHLDLWHRAQAAGR